MEMRWIAIFLLGLSVDFVLGQHCCLQCVYAYKAFGGDASGVSLYSSCWYPCYACAAGQHVDCSFLGFCYSCDPGTYAVYTSMSDYNFVDSDCKTCEAGKYNSAYGKTACSACSTSCPAGYIKTAECTTRADIVCTPCSASSSTCTGPTYWSCPAGSTSYSCNTCIRANSLTLCPLGNEPSYVCNGKGDFDPPCTPCKAGFYKSGILSLYCVGCSIGSYTDTIGSLSCAKACTNKPSVGAVYLDWTSTASSNNCPWYVIV